MWWESILDDDLTAFESVSIDAPWSDLVESSTTAEHHTALTDAAAAGELELPDDPESEIGSEGVLEGEDLGAEGDWDEFDAALDDEFGVAIEDLAEFTVPYSPMTESEAAVLFIESADDGWPFFGMEPAP